ncbi:hypothetical protein D9756_008257 [Leucocoprinus leucothites]|uniref:BD-FAE-like domain-containing protein n=1 Tax=Leucocoprinus leucothites TaxID=201217 RepID=A0A8H5FWD1_9AGAR|nr:hypothetical protein D9756_008257 [Leucoagaricus leucothites]
MDQIPAIPWNDLILTRELTLVAFEPVLEKNRSLITSVVKRSFQFGQTDRHYLDVYYPPTKAATEGPTPILFFIYGGGFVSGDRGSGPPLGLGYGCLGSFFARQGFLTVIPDYRLAPQHRYPSAIEDILQAIQWTVSNASELVSSTTPSPGIDSLFVIGQSAGAVHLATFLFHPTLLPVDSDLRRRIKGVVLVSGIYHYFRTNENGPGIYELHWGTEENARENSAVSLLIRSFAWLPKDKIPRLKFITAQFEPKWLIEENVRYRRLLEWHLEEPVEMDMVKDHNHISLGCALSSGEGEEWGVQVADWMKGVNSSRVDIGREGLLKDVEETDTVECPRCKHRRVRSFSIEIGTQSIRAKTFTICLNCGNKWVEVA